MMQKPDEPIIRWAPGKGAHEFPHHPFVIPQAVMESLKQRLREFAAKNPLATQADTPIFRQNTDSRMTVKPEDL